LEERGEAETWTLSSIRLADLAERIAKKQYRMAKRGKKECEECLTCYIPFGQRMCKRCKEDLIR